MSIIFADGESWGSSGRAFRLLLETARESGPLPDGVTDQLLDGYEAVKGISLELEEPRVQQQLARLLFDAAITLADQPAPAGWNSTGLRELFLELAALLQRHYRLGGAQA